MIPSIVQPHVIPLLDMDGRRALGIFGRLKLPPETKKKLEQICIVRMRPGTIVASERSELVFFCCPHDSKKNVLRVIDQQLEHPSTTKNQRIAIYFARRALEAIEIPPKHGLEIRAGIANDGRMHGHVRVTRDMSWAAHFADLQNLLDFQ